MNSRHSLKTILASFVLAAFFLPTSIAQPKLRAFIGGKSKPKDTDSISSMQKFSGSFATSGLQIADTINGFKLYSASGDSLDIATELSKGKPVLLIAGAYTCPVFRGKVDAINTIANGYAGKVSVFIIYVVEPHPIAPDISPYNGKVWTTSQNCSDSILYLQPKTYRDKKGIVQDMQKRMKINVPVFIDGPNNEWWSTFGPAPNNAYLIKPDGVIFSKQDWFSNKKPNDIVPSIDELLKLLSVKELVVH